MIPTRAVVLLCLIFRSAAPLFAGESAAPLRSPAVPLAVCDPYFSVWSPSDRLVDSLTMHWTGQTQALASTIRVDGRPWRLMGLGRHLWADFPNAEQIGPAAVYPTRTAYTFRAGGVAVRLTFLTPMLPDDLDVFSRPVTYLTWEIRSCDGRQHDVSLYFDCSAELAVNTPDQKVAFDRREIPGSPKLATMRAGSVDQPVLKKSGDYLRIDWGYFYLAAPREECLTTAIGRERDLSGAFAQGQPLPNDDPRGPRIVAGQLAGAGVHVRPGQDRPARPSRGTSSSPMTTSIRSNTWAFGCVPIGGATGRKRPICCGGQRPTTPIWRGAPRPSTRC